MTQRKAEREDQLLETATHLFKEEKGYPSTSLQDLAGALDTQKGNLYRDNDRKAELRRQLRERTAVFPAFEIDEAYASDLSPPENSATSWRTAL